MADKIVRWWHRNRAVRALRSFALTAPVIAAADTALEVLYGNLNAVLAEPWLVAATVLSSLQASGASPELRGAGFWGYVGAYALASLRAITSPLIDQRGQ